jgi:aminoglycoside phosphotransferase (APT) family kinase protein
VKTVLAGGDGYCLHDSLLKYSQDTARLLDTLQQIVLTHQSEPHHTNDIVHDDFQPANILVYNQQISGIIDWDASFAGDRIFDIATLLFYSYDIPEVREQLWHYALKHATLNLLSVYFAHLILRQVDWSLRFHDSATSDKYIERGYRILADIAQKSL